MRTTAAAAGALLLAMALLPTTAQALDQVPYLGTIGLVAADYCPAHSLPADGRALAVREHQALYTLLGDRFGADGQETFNLPDLRGRTPKGLLYCLCVDGVWPNQDP